MNYKDFFQKNVTIYKSIPYTKTSYVWTIPGDDDVKKSLCASIISHYVSTQLGDILHDKKSLVSSIGTHAGFCAQAPNIM